MIFFFLQEITQLAEDMHVRVKESFIWISSSFPFCYADKNDIFDFGSNKRQKTIKRRNNNKYQSRQLEKQ